MVLEFRNTCTSIASHIWHIWSITGGDLYWICLSIPFANESSQMLCILCIRCLFLVIPMRLWLLPLQHHVTLTIHLTPSSCAQPQGQLSIHLSFAYSTIELYSYARVNDRHGCRYGMYFVHVSNTYFCTLTLCINEVSHNEGDSHVVTSRITVLWVDDPPPHTHTHPTRVCNL